MYDKLVIHHEKYLWHTHSSCNQEKNISRANIIVKRLLEQTKGYYCKRALQICVDFVL